MKDKVILAVRATSGTRLEVPDPTAGSTGKPTYQIYLKSSEPIDAIIVSPLDEELLAQEKNVLHWLLISFFHFVDPQHDADGNTPSNVLRPPTETSDYFFNSGGEGVTDLYTDFW